MAKKRVFIRYARIDGVDKKLLIQKKGKKLIIKDFYTKKVVSETIKYNINNFYLGFEPIIRKRVAKRPSGEKVPYEISTRRLRGRELSRERLNNANKDYFVTRSSWIKHYYGKMTINVTFFGKGTQTTAEASSRRLKDLSKPSERETAFDEAFSGALGQIAFSYERFRVNWIHYDYFLRAKK